MSRRALVARAVCILLVLFAAAWWSGYFVGLAVRAFHWWRTW
jgi:hypothetical protein